jgi:hypothetical protein
LETQDPPPGCMGSTFPPGWASSLSAIPSRQALPGSSLPCSVGHFHGRDARQTTATKEPEVLRHSGQQALEGLKRVGQVPEPRLDPQWGRHPGQSPG